MYSHICLYCLYRIHMAEVPTQNMMIDDDDDDDDSDDEMIVGPNVVAV